MTNWSGPLIEPEEPQNKCTCGARSLDECWCDYEQETE